MKSMDDKIIQTEILYSLLGFEPYVLIFSLVVVTWLFYKVFLQEVSEERHKIIQNHFRGLFRNFIGLTILFLIYMAMHESQELWSGFLRIKPYVALVTFFWGLLTFVKTCRQLVLLYMFMSSMQAGVPMLIVNIFSLLLSTILLFWSGSRLFGLQLGPLLATSAAFSIILGLALQDTLGNLFAGISLQIDKSFEIGDWLEITQGMQKTIGQVKEISWRSTTLVGISDELITMPNRAVATAQLSNFSPPEQPIVRTQTFRVKLDAPLELTKEVLERSIADISDVRGLPAPYAYVNDTNENYISFKIVYFIDSYGLQNIVGDKVLRKGIEDLQKNAISLARPYVEYVNKTEV